MARLIQSPVMVDEFDVFMDEANRRLAFKTMIQTAMDSQRQYIFITPHNIDHVLQVMKEKNIPNQVFRMEPPER